MKNPSRGRGFTLIEIMVTIVIIAVIISTAVMSLGVLGGDDRRLQTEADRFASLVNVARDDATLQGRDFGLEVFQGGYRFVEWDPVTEQWAELYDETLRPRSLPEDAEFELYLEDKRIPLELDAAALNDEDNSPTLQKFAPHVLVWSSGDATPFELHIVDPQLSHRVILTSDEYGETEVKSDDTN